MIRAIVGALSILALAGGAAIQDDGELVQISVIFRHGDRTTYSFYPTDPYRNMTFYPMGLGGLTNLGKMQEYLLGRYLRKHYDAFLGDTYTNDEVEMRSTNVMRTKMSAQLVLAGLFPPNKVQLWNNELAWQPALVDYRQPEHEDILHRNRDKCPFKQAVWDDQKNNEELRKKYVDPYSDTYKYIQKFSGQNMTSPGDMSTIYFNLKCEHDMGLVLPSWTESVYPKKIHEAASVRYPWEMENLEVRKINSGYHLKKIIQDFEDKINNAKPSVNKKAFLYSGHESTVGYMLVTLDLHQNAVPEYSSALVFELIKKNSGYYVKLRYRPHPDADEPTDFTLPGCEPLCPFDKFKELTKYVIPHLDIKEACNIPYSRNSDKSGTNANLDYGNQVPQKQA